MNPAEDAIPNGEDQFEWSEGASWTDPGIHASLATVANDIVIALCALSAKIKKALSETQTLPGEVQEMEFSHQIFEDESLASIRIALFHLLAAISCEGLINRFCYFELPKDAGETLEKLQPTEKLLVAAAFLGQPNMKSSHVYEGLKSLVAWRNHYAHGHNPGRSARSLHKNHAVPFEAKEIGTLEDELEDLRKAAEYYRTVNAWICNSGTREITKVDWFLEEASRFVQLFGCFSVTEGQFAPNSEGLCFLFFDLDVDLKKLADLRK